MIESTLKITDELECLLRCDRSPLAEDPFSEVMESSSDVVTKLDSTRFLGGVEGVKHEQQQQLDSDIQKHLTNFSLITHGFGAPAMVAVLNGFKHYLTAMKSNCESILNEEGNTYKSYDYQNHLNHHQHQQQQQQQQSSNYPFYNFNQSNNNNNTEIYQSNGFSSLNKVSTVGNTHFSSSSSPLSSSISSSSSSSSASSSPIPSASASAAATAETSSKKCLLTNLKVENKET
jgi:hypothetical protein